MAKGTGTGRREKGSGASDASSSASASRQAGKPDRTFIEAPVMLKAANAGVHGVACDVSEHGIKVLLDEPPALGPVSVKLVGLPSLAGEICWRSPHRVGVRLASPFAPDVLADWIKYHGGGRR